MTGKKYFLCDGCKIGFLVVYLQGEWRQGKRVVIDTNNKDMEAYMTKSIAARNGWLLGVLLLLAVVPAMASPVSVDKAEAVARHFWNCHREADVEAVTGLMNRADVPFDAFYVFSPEGGMGFVVVAADDAVQPVLAYSFENRFDIEGKDNVIYWFGGYQEQIDWAREHGVEATKEIAAQWVRYANGKKDGSGSGTTLTAVAPLMTTIWDQTGSSSKRTYNKYTPNDYSYSGKIYATPTGCTATAMAQVMNYWKHPQQGTGSYSYRLSNLSPDGSSQTFSADFSEVSFEWDKMPYALSSASSDGQIAAVATLMYNCGIAVGMRYSATGSSAAVIGRNSASTEKALMTYFDYSSDLQSRRRSRYSDEEWAAMLKNELDSLRPIPYAGYDESVGHAFVCDGYDNSGKYHFNWGWSGSNDGYYALDNLVPGSGGVGGGSYSFNLNQQCLIRVHPNGTTTPPPPTAVVDDDCFIMSFPYVMDFENGHQCCTIADSNRDNNKWKYVSGAGWPGGNNCLAFDSQNKYGSNDWFNLPKISAPGKYTVQWYAMCRNKAYPESYEVWAEDSLIYSAVHGQPTYNSATYYRRSADFVVDSTHSVRIRFRCTSENKYQFFIDSIQIRLLSLSEVSEQDSSLMGMRPMAAIQPQGLRMIPNPAGSSVVIEAAQEAMVDIIDAEGRVVTTGKTGVAMDIRHLGVGIYLVRATTKDGMQTGKLIKK